MLNNIARIQRALRQAHLDAILLTNENDRRFATGFPSSDGTVIVTVHQAFFITDSRYIEAARAALAGIAQVLLCSHEAPMRTLVQDILREANVQLLGGEEQTTSYAEFTAYEQLLGLRLQPAQSILRTLRASKQPEELAMMYQAQQITDETFAQICTVIRPGMTEREIAAELIYRMLRLGAEGTSFDPIVLTGPDTSMPHGVAGSRVLQDGDFVTMDFGVLYQGYCSDMTRTVALGHATEEMRKVYDTVLRAQLAGIAASHAGAARASTALPATSSRRPATARISATAMATASVSRSTKRRIAPRATRTRSLPALCAPQSRASTFRANSASASRMS